MRRFLRFGLGEVRAPPQFAQIIGTLRGFAALETRVNHVEPRIFVDKNRARRCEDISTKDVPNYTFVVKPRYQTCCIDQCTGMWTNEVRICFAMSKPVTSKESGSPGGVSDVQFYFQFYF